MVSYSVKCLLITFAHFSNGVIALFYCDPPMLEMLSLHQEEEERGTKPHSKLVDKPELGLNDSSTFTLCNGLLSTEIPPPQREGAPGWGHLHGAVWDIQLGWFLLLQLCFSNRNVTICARHINYKGTLSILMIHGICCKATASTELPVWRKMGVNVDMIWNLV